MEINWSTFVFEIINFLVLVWILKRFLYLPVLDIINRRRQAIESQLAEAQKQHAETTALRQQYEHRLADWEQERRKAMQKLNMELEEIRLQQTEKLKMELAEQEKKAMVAREKQDRQLKRELYQKAFYHSTKFASRLLAEAAGPELENRLLDLLLQDLKALPEDSKKSFANKWETTPEHILVTSAYPLTDSRRQQLEDALKHLTGRTTPVNYKQDKNLLAGVEISVGSWLLQLSVRDELRGFVELADVEN